MAMIPISPALDGQPLIIVPGAGMAGTTVSVQTWGQLPDTQNLTVAGGRMVSAFGVQSVDGLNTVPQPDGSTLIDCREVTTGGTFAATSNSGGAIQIEVEPSIQPKGTAPGLQYCLPVDANGRFIYEPGQHHRKIYFSLRPGAMTKAMIAADAGVAESTVTLAWLMARPQYGGSEDMPVDVSMLGTFRALHNVGIYGRRSDWFLFERGYEYSFGMGFTHVSGQDDLHPVVYGTWGTGERPFLPKFLWTHSAPRFYAFVGWRTESLYLQHGHRLIVEDMRITGHEESVIRSEYCTIHETAFYDIYRIVPKTSTRTYWSASGDRISGLFFSGGDSFFLSQCFFDACGWREGFSETNSFNINNLFPPSFYNHNTYGSFSNLDVLASGTWFSRAASQGLQTRAGGVVYQCYFWENNIALGLQSANDLERTGQFGYVIDSIALGAGYKSPSEFAGALNIGLGLNCFGAMKGSIVAHKANPADPAEIAARSGAGDQGRPDGPNERHRVNDTIVYKWWTKRQSTDWNDKNVPDIPEATLDSITLQNYAADVLGTGTATGIEFIDWLKVQPYLGPEIHDALKFVHQGFGKPLPSPATPEDMDFVPDLDFEGFWFSNRYNWTGGVVPGAHLADTFNLRGNFCRFNHLTRSVAAATFEGGALDAVGGRLSVGTMLDAADVTVRHAGQFYCGGSSHPLTVKAEAGRVALTGEISDLDLTATGKAQILLGPDTTVPAGRTLTLSGPRVVAGWDGTGTATLRIEGTLAFRAGVSLRLVNVYGGADDGIGANKHRIVSCGNIANRADGSVLGLMADMYNTDEEHVGALEICDITGPLPVPGDEIRIGESWVVDKEYQLTKEVFVTADTILSRSVPKLARFRSGSIGDGVTAPTVIATLVLAAGANIVIVDRDLLLPGTYDLTGEGVTVVNEGAALPAGVALTGGILVLTVA